MTAASPRAVTLQALRKRRLGEHVSVATFTKEFDDAGLTAKQRAQFASYVRGYCVNTGWTEPSSLAPSKGRRVCIYKLEKRPTAAEVKAAAKCTS